VGTAAKNAAAAAPPGVAPNAGVVSVECVQGGQVAHRLGGSASAANVSHGNPYGIAPVEESQLALQPALQIRRPDEVARNGRNVTGGLQQLDLPELDLQGHMKLKIAHLYVVDYKRDESCSPRSGEV
jgi:hypothetical protein